MNGEIKIALLLSAGIFIVVDIIASYVRTHRFRNYEIRFDEKVERGHKR